MRGAQAPSIRGRSSPKLSSSYSGLVWLGRAAPVMMDQNPSRGAIPAAWRIAATGGAFVPSPGATRPSYIDPRRRRMPILRTA